MRQGKGDQCPSVLSMPHSRWRLLSEWRLKSAPTSNHTQDLAPATGSWGQDETCPAFPRKRAFQLGVERKPVFWATAVWSVYVRDYKGEEGVLECLEPVNSWTNRIFTYFLEEMVLHLLFAHRTTFRGFMCFFQFPGSRNAIAINHSAFFLTCKNWHYFIKFTLINHFLWSPFLTMS